MQRNLLIAILDDRLDRRKGRHENLMGTKGKRFQNNRIQLPWHATWL
jgi:hypothetical protein